MQAEPNFTPTATNALQRSPLTIASIALGTASSLLRIAKPISAARWLTFAKSALLYRRRQRLSCRSPSLLFSQVLRAAPLSVASQRATCRRAATTTILASADSSLHARARRLRRLAFHDAPLEDTLMPAERRARRAQSRTLPLPHHYRNALPFLTLASGCRFSLLFTRYRHAICAGLLLRRACSATISSSTRRSSVEQAPLAPLFSRLRSAAIVSDYGALTAGRRRPPAARMQEDAAAAQAFVPRHDERKVRHRSAAGFRYRHDDATLLR